MLRMVFRKASSMPGFHACAIRAVTRCRPLITKLMEQPTIIPTTWMEPLLYQLLNQADQTVVLITTIMTTTTNITMAGVTATTTMMTIDEADAITITIVRITGMDPILMNIT